MRVLVHIHTMNDAAVIEQALEALRHQTRPPDAILIVDNASTDETLDRAFPANTTIIRNTENLGSAGAVLVGFAHALAHEFDWTWIIDADSVPEPDALANLLRFYADLPRAEQETVCFLGCRLAHREGASDHRPHLLTASGVDRLTIDLAAGHCRCDCFIWSGSLFQMAAVAKIGLPAADYFIDLAELEYGYRARKLGYSSYIVFSSILHQDVGRRPGVLSRTWRFGPFSLLLYDMSPLRCYYHVRNMLYFWLYEYRPVRPRWIVRSIVHAIVFPSTFALRPVRYRRHLLACLRGFWDGVTMHLERRH